MSRPRDRQPGRHEFAGCVPGMSHASAPIEIVGGRYQPCPTRRLAPALGGLCLMQALSGCVGYEKPDLALEIPDNYRTARRKPDAALPALDWWRSFRSRELTTLIEQAQTANLDIAARSPASSRPTRRCASPARRCCRSSTVNGSAQRSRHRLGGRTCNAAVHRIADRNSLYNANLSASYEIDFWGKNRATLLGQRADCRRQPLRPRGRRAHAQWPPSPTPIFRCWRAGSRCASRATISPPRPACSA